MKQLRMQANQLNETFCVWDAAPTQWDGTDRPLQV